MLSKLCIFLLSLGALAPCFGQTSYTATPLNLPFPNAGLGWLSDDARSGFGGSLQISPYQMQCFSYQDGTATLIPTPGFDCELDAANEGIAVLKLNVPGDWVHDTFVTYRTGKFTMLTPPAVTRPPNAGTDLTIYGVNKKGQMAASYICPAQTPTGIIECAYLISGDGAFTRLPDLGGYSNAMAINENGDVAGWVCAPGDYPPPYCPSLRIVIWPHDGGMTDLSSLTSMKLGLPTAINGKGQLIGNTVQLSTGPGYFYDGAGTITPIQANGTTVRPESLNDRGEVVGYYLAPAGNGVGSPFYYFNGVTRDLNTSIVDLPTNLYLGGPTFINNAGQMLAPGIYATQPVSAVANGTAPGQYLVSPSNAPASPAISAVLNDFSHLAGVAGATWIQIIGQNLSSTTRSWTSSDFGGNSLPTSLDGVSVMIDGLPAYVSSVSPTQIVVLAPDDAATGSVQVQVTDAQGTSTPFTVTKTSMMPALLNSQTLPAAASDSGGFVTAFHADGKPVCDPVDYNCTGRLAVAGETITLFGTGFGPTKTPAPAGQTISAPAELSGTLTGSIGGTPAVVTYAARISSGLDQINVTVPGALSYGKAPLVVTINGLSTPDYLYLQVAGPSN